MKFTVAILLSVFGITGVLAASAQYKLSNDNLLGVKDSTKSSKWYQSKAVRISIAPASLFVAGAISWDNRENIREIRNRYIPSFSKEFDDYTQWVPALTVYGLNAAGVKGKHSVKRATVSYGFSLGIMALLVNGLKYTTKVERPDGSTHNSFPSGHTATAFTNATFLHKEYGQYRSELYSVGGYALGIVTGLGRQLNNRHWVSDVLVGAGIGILSTELGYIFADKLFDEKGMNPPLPDPSGKPVSGKPSFLEIKLGYADAVGQDLTNNSNQVSANRGFNFGFEGAWFFHKNFGIGAEWSVVSFPMSSNFQTADPDFPVTTEGVYTEPMGLRTIYGGPYFSIPLRKGWFITSKLIGGSAAGATGSVIAQVNEEYQEVFGATELPVLRYDPDTGIGWKTGIGIQKRVSRNVAIKFYTDFNFARQNFEVSELSAIDTEGNYTYTSLGTDRVNFNYLALGFTVTAFLW